MTQQNVPLKTSKKTAGSGLKARKALAEKRKKDAANQQLELSIKSLLLQGKTNASIAKSLEVSPNKVGNIKKKLIASGDLADRKGNFREPEVLDPETTPYQKVQERRNMEVIKEELMDDLSHISLRATKAVINDIDNASAKEAMAIADKAIHNLRLINGESTSNVAMVVGSLASGDPD